MATQKQKDDLIKQELSPAIETGEGSGYFPKDEIFDKEKTYIDKSDGQQKKIPADWRKIHVGHVNMVLHKGVEVTAKQIVSFSEEEKKYYLVKKK